LQVVRVNVKHVSGDGVKAVIAGNRGNVVIVFVTVYVYKAGGSGPYAYAFTAAE
jgi:hypothetical protein